MDQKGEAPKPVLQKLLDVVERVGNRVPHPAVLFLLLIAVVVLLSHALRLTGTSVSYQRINPETHQVEQVTTAVNSLLAADGVRLSERYWRSSWPTCSKRRTSAALLPYAVITSVAWVLIFFAWYWLGLPFGPG
jgi:p-aminobenzoyl-glutamate transporter AbgT